MTVCVLLVIHLLICVVGLDSRSNAAMAASPSSSTIKAMYVLGDSSVDCGDNTLLYPLLRHNLSLHPCDGSYTSLLPHFLGKKIGLQDTTLFYNQNGSMDVVLNGINFGSVGATIMFNPTSPSHQSLNQQLRQAFEICQLLHLRLGQENATNFIQSSTLFYLSFGKDDFIDFFLDTQTSPKLYNGVNFSHILVNQMINAVRGLYNAGVRKIVYTGVLPLGCAPRVLSSYNGTCVDEINKAVLEYNTQLEQRIVKLNLELSDAQIIFCDIYRVMMQIITNPHATYGFENVSSACCGLGKYGGISGCLSKDIACKDASTYLWWDLYNPSQAVNLLIADSAWSGQPFSDICRPITVQKLVESSK